MDGFCLIRRVFVATLPAFILPALCPSVPGAERVINTTKSANSFAEARQLGVRSAFATAQAEREIAARNDLERTLAAFRALLGRQGADSGSGCLSGLPALTSAGPAMATVTSPTATRATIPPRRVRSPARPLTSLSSPAGVRRLPR